MVDGLDSYTSEEMTQQEVGAGVTEKSMQQDLDDFQDDGDGAKEHLEKMTDEDGKDCDIKDKTESKSHLSDMMEDDHGKEQDKSDLEEQEEQENLAGKKRKIAKPKRPLSAYMIFMMENRSKIAEENKDLKIGGVAKKVAELWHKLSLEDRKQYNERAKTAKDEYKEALKEYNMQDHGPSAEEGAVLDESQTLVLPVSRIMKIAKKDPQVKKLSKEAGQVITKATELFLEFFAETLGNQVRSNKKKTVDYKAMRACVMSGPEQFEFLVDDFPAPEQNTAPILSKAQKKSTAENRTGKKQDEAQHSLQSFFPSKPEDSVEGATAA